MMVMKESSEDVPRNLVNLEVDVGVLKNQVDLLTKLCAKLDLIIEKMLHINRDRILELHQNMEDRDNGLDQRIDDLSGKIVESENRIMGKIEALKSELLTVLLSISSADQTVVKGKVEKLNQYVWIILGGIILLAWLMGHENFDIIRFFLKK